MKSMKSVLFVVLMSFPTLGHAWTYVGNAGNVVVCEDKVMGFYDRFELSLRYDWVWDQEVIESAGSTSEFDEVQIAAAYIKRIQRLNPILYGKLNTYLATFMDEVTFVKGYLPNVLDDAGVVVLPAKDCSLELLIVQKPVQYPKKSLYTINQIYWDKLSTQDRAVAILHEIIYRVALSRGKAPESSEGVRLINEVILSNKVKTMSEDEFANLLRLVFTPGSPGNPAPAK
ncbi:hypothetical protein ACLSU7_00750 [Bdellovibrio sp. HCB185ZH]|uniref:hypothetical protein n=1 Tax=Bdellovibrio sp. HCB185ZH TaxID=3394235 RepID=UPI0039A70816